MHTRHTGCLFIVRLLFTGDRRSTLSPCAQISPSYFYYLIGSNLNPSLKLVLPFTCRPATQGLLYEPCKSYEEPISSNYFLFVRFEVSRPWITTLTCKFYYSVDISIRSSIFSHLFSSTILSRISSCGGVLGGKTQYRWSHISPSAVQCIQSTVHKAEGSSQHTGKLAVMFVHVCCPLSTIFGTITT